MEKEEREITEETGMNVSRPTRHEAGLLLIRLRILLGCLDGIAEKLPGSNTRISVFLGTCSRSGTPTHSSADAEPD